MISHIEDVESKIQEHLKQVSDIWNANIIVSPLEPIKVLLLKEPKELLLFFYDSWNTL